jgi:hypothetical protein
LRVDFLNNFGKLIFFPKMNTPADSPRVRVYFPTVKDFERKENGDPIVDSLRGPDRIEARQQVVRERLVAAAELKLLQDELKWCYHKEGVNHYENCKGIADQVLKKLKSPYWGSEKSPAREY